MNRNDLLSVLFLILIAYNDAAASSSCNNVENKLDIEVKLKRHLLCEYDVDVRPVQYNNNTTRVEFRMMPSFLRFVSIYKNYFAVNKKFLEESNVSKLKSVKINTRFFCILLNYLSSYKIFRGVS